MGIRLVVEVLDHAPADLTPAEVLVLVAIAEQARDQTREAWLGMPKLAQRVRLSPDAVRRALQRLARRGLEVRVALGLGKDGRPFYSNSRTATIYRLPSFFDQSRRDSGPALRGDPGTASNSTRRDHSPALLSVKGGPQSRPSPHKPSIAAAAKQVEIVREATGATLAEAQAVVTMVAAAKPDVINRAGLLVTMARDGDLVDWLELVRSRAQTAAAVLRDTERLAWLASLDDLPPCPHEVAGGDVPDPAGWVRCPVCRRARAA